MMHDMSSTEAILLREYGGPEQLKPERVALAAPGPSEVLVRHNAIGVNFHDCYVRSGLYRTLALPGIPGLEAAGTVEAVGDGVASPRPGDRIAWISPLYGAYAAARILPAELAIPLPDTLGDAEAAASLMKACTVRMLLHDAHRLEAGQTILVHAAAGGVGQLLCGWARHLGATVIGTVGSAEKADIAARAGAHHLILYRDEDVAERVRAITGTGVAAVYDAIGADTFAASLQCLDFGGTLVSYGQASGPVAPFTMGDLAVRSLKVTRPIVFHYLRTGEQRARLTAEALAAFEAGIIAPIRPLRLPLAEAAEAHRILEAGRSPGGIVLVPGPQAALS